MKIELINDYFSAVIFYEYVKGKDILNNILKKESQNLYEQIILNNNEINNHLSMETIKNNIKYDFSRKIVLENILDNYKEYIFSNPNDLNFIYSYKIKYLTIPLERLLPNTEFQNVINSRNFIKLNNYLEDNKIDYHLDEIEIKDFDKINTKIKNLTITPKKYIFEKNLNFYKITKVEKRLEISNGVYYRLINFETNQNLKKDQENCSFIQSLDNIKTSKEYEFNKLNNQIKNNLVSIDDFIIFENNNLYNYIFLCEIRVNEEFLKEININKKISIAAKNIELDFINKYSKKYNAKKYYE
ncbi:MAG: hypothetical protein ACJ0RC_03630 [Alphaproteobacteria bacterium]